MKGKMTTGAGKPSRSEPWKQTPEDPQAALSLQLARRGSHPLPQFSLSLPFKSKFQTVGGGVGGGWQGPSLREAISSTVPREVSRALLGTSAISGKGQRSHSKLRERRRRELEGRRSREPGGLIFPVPEGGVFLLDGLHGVLGTLKPAPPSPMSLMTLGWSNSFMQTASLRKSSSSDLVQIATWGREEGG